MPVKLFTKELRKRVRKAQIIGVNQTMSACVIHAKNNHSWKNQTSVLEGSINIADFAQAKDKGVKGTWGSRDVRYARIHEEGGEIVPVKAQALHFRLPDGTFATVKKVTIPARPYLRPAADVHYPSLGKRIRHALAAMPDAGGA